MSKINQLILTLIDVIRSRIQIVLLRREINRLKIANYDVLEASVQSLRRALKTQDRNIADLHEQLQARDHQVSLLQAEYRALIAQSESADGVTSDSERLVWFKKLQFVAVQLPTIRAALAEGAPLTASDILDMISPLDEALRDLGFEQIGQAGITVSFDPTRHHAVGRGTRNLSVNDEVRVRYVGYLYKGNVISKAEVTRVQREDVALALN